MQSQQPMDTTAIAYRINALERDIQHLQTQLASYVPARESELQLASIRSTVERIERDLQGRFEVNSFIKGRPNPIRGYGSAVVTSFGMHRIGGRLSQMVEGPVGFAANEWVGALAGLLQSGHGFRT